MSDYWATLGSEIKRYSSHYRGHSIAPKDFPPTTELALISSNLAIAL